MSNDNQKLYQSGLRMLLWLVKHSRPDIAIAVQELTKVLDCASATTMTGMFWTIKSILELTSHALKLKPDFCEEEIWRVVAICDSDYATEQATRKSVSKFVLYLCGIPIYGKTRDKSW